MAAMLDPQATTAHMDGLEGVQEFTQVMEWTEAVLSGAGFAASGVGAAASGSKTAAVGGRESIGSENQKQLAMSVLCNLLEAEHDRLRDRVHVAAADLAALSSSPGAGGGGGGVGPQYHQRLLMTIAEGAVVACKTAASQCRSSESATDHQVLFETDADGIP